MVDKMLLQIPTRLETERLYLRCYEPGDGSWFYPMSQSNRAHLLHHESENVVMTIRDEPGAEATVRQLAANWAARDCFFLGAFDRATDEFVAQVYVGPVNWALPEYEIGYFADVDHEGRGFVAEAVRAALRFVFEPLRAHRVRLECSDTNARSYRLAERCGLVLEGHVRENRREPDGTFSGTLFYGMLKREFEALYGTTGDGAPEWEGDSHA
jgi:RimJ/RimL family protein N-acetyltransferase